MTEAHWAVLGGRAFERANREVEEYAELEYPGESPEWLLASWVGGAPEAAKRRGVGRGSLRAGLGRWLARLVHRGQRPVPGTCADR